MEPIRLTKATAARVRSLTARIHKTACEEMPDEAAEGARVTEEDVLASLIEIGLDAVETDISPPTLPTPTWGHAKAGVA